MAEVDAVLTVVVAALVIDRCLLGLRLQRLARAQQASVVQRSIAAVQKGSRGSRAFLKPEAQSDRGQGQP